MCNNHVKIVYINYDWVMHNKCCNLDFFVLFSLFYLISRLALLMNFESSSVGKISAQDNRVPHFYCFVNFYLPVTD